MKARSRPSVMPCTSDREPEGQPRIRVSTMPADTNCYGDVFGGWLVGQMDLAAGAVASIECGGRAVTAAIDAISFHRPVKVGNEVSIYARISAVGRSSMQIIVEAWQRERTSRASSRVTDATFTFVAVGEDGAPRPVYERLLHVTDQVHAVSQPATQISSGRMDPSGSATA